MITFFYRTTITITCGLVALTHLIVIFRYHSEHYGLLFWTLMMPYYFLQCLNLLMSSWDPSWDAVHLPRFVDPDTLVLCSKQIHHLLLAGMIKFPGIIPDFRNVDFASGYCCCLPTHMTLASGGSPDVPRLWSTSQLLRPSGQQYSHPGLSINPGVTMWCVCGYS